MDRRRLFWIFSVVAGIATLLACVVFLPPYIVSLDLADRTPTTTEALQAINSSRTTLVQAFGGLILLSGAYVTWRQYQSSREAAREELRLTREGRLTERLTAAVEQLSSPEPAVRVGGVYALGRLSDESPDDRESIEQILATYIRTRAGITAERQDTGIRLPVRLPEVQAALTVLGRRPRIADPNQYVSLDLSSSDLRRAELSSAHLSRVRFRDCLLTRTSLQGSDLRGADLRRADLVGSNLTGAHADLLTWWPDDFDPIAAGVRLDPSLAGADLRGADLRYETSLASTDVRGALANQYTVWPEDFDWRAAGVIHAATDPAESS
jgi:hypothetical protein